MIRRATECPGQCDRNCGRSNRIREEVEETAYSVANSSDIRGNVPGVLMHKLGQSVYIFIHL